MPKERIRIDGGTPRVGRRAVDGRKLRQAGRDPRTHSDPTLSSVLPPLSFNTASNTVRNERAPPRSSMMRKTYTP